MLNKLLLSLVVFFVAVGIIAQPLNTAPEVSIDIVPEPIDGGIITQSVVDLVIGAVDPDGDSVVRLQLELNDRLIFDEVFAPGEFTSPFVYQWRTNRWKGAPVWIEVYAYDEFGNRGPAYRQVVIPFTKYCGDEPC